MNITKTIFFILVICTQTIMGRSHNDQSINLLSNDSYGINNPKRNLGKSYAKNDSTTSNKIVNFIARVGYIFYDFNNKKGLDFYSAEAICGFRFSPYYMIGLGFGLNPIQRDIGLYPSYIKDTVFDNVGNSHIYESYTIKVLKSNYPIFINQRVNLHESKKVSFSLNVNTGISLSNCYDFSVFYLDNYYWTTVLSQRHINHNLYLSIGTGIKWKINRRSAILLDLETDYIPFNKSDDFKLLYFGIKLGFEFNAIFL